MTGAEAIEKMKVVTSAEERAMIAVEFLSDPKSYEEVGAGWGESYLPVRDDGQMVGRMARDGIAYLLAAYDSKHCLQKVTTEALREHLSAVATGNAGDVYIARHLVGNDCVACEKRSQAIRAMEPFTREHVPVDVFVSR